MYPLWLCQLVIQSQEAKNSRREEHCFKKQKVYVTKKNCDLKSQSNVIDVAIYHLLAHGLTPNEVHDFLLCVARSRERFFFCPKCDIDQEYDAGG